MWRIRLRANGERRYGLPAWMLSAACATFVLGSPLIAADALLELRVLLSALPSGPSMP